MDRDDVAGAFLFIFVAILVVSALVWIGVIHPQAVDSDCKERYGSSWVGKTPPYSPDFCVDKDGSVKYLQ